MSIFSPSEFPDGVSIIYNSQGQLQANGMVLQNVVTQTPSIPNNGWIFFENASYNIVFAPQTDAAFGIINAAQTGNPRWQVLTATGKFAYYAAIATAGNGIPGIYAAGLGVSLNTTSTAVCSLTPTGTSTHYRVSWTLSCKTNSTPTLTLAWTDPQAGAQSITLYGSAMTSNTVQQGTYSVYATNASSATIAVTGSDSVALGDIFATATIEQMQ